VKPILEKHFILVKLDVAESANKKALENPGGADVLNKLGGTNAGLPFYGFLNAKGELIVSSKKNGSDNIGYPGQPQELAWFMTMLNKAAPGMNKAERQTIENWLRNPKK
jgi:hypothetical protein